MAKAGSALPGQCLSDTGSSLATGGLPCQHINPSLSPHPAASHVFNGLWFSYGSVGHYIWENSALGSMSLSVAGSLDIAGEHLATLGKAAAIEHQGQGDQWAL